MSRIMRELMEEGRATREGKPAPVVQSGPPTIVEDMVWPFPPPTAGQAVCGHGIPLTHICLACGRWAHTPVAPSAPVAPVTPPTAGTGVTDGDRDRYDGMMG